MEVGHIVARWEQVCADMALAAMRSGRTAQDVRLVAVSKYHPAESVAALYQAGQRVFGENYVQEALTKREALPVDIEWHFIGHLQTNKVRQVVGCFDLLHGVDSLKLAQSLQNKAAALGMRQKILVQVNLAREPQKSGIAPDQLPKLAEYLLSASDLDWQGLMLMPPIFDDPEGARPYFAALRQLRESLTRQYGILLPELSMGMTGDFVAAIEEGATMVRVGTRIFGERA